jgi:hypothetical protein
LAEFAALVESFGAGKEDVIVAIVGILPEVGGVRFADVDDVEGRAILVFLVEFV